MFYQGRPIYNFTNVPVSVVQSSSKDKYNTGCTTVMAIANFKMIHNELIKKYTYEVPEPAPLIIFDSKSYVCMAKNGKVTKHISHISRKIYLIRNGEYLNLHKIVWCEGGLKSTDTGTNNVREDELNTRLGDVLWLDLPTDRTLVQEG